MAAPPKRPRGQLPQAYTLDAALALAHATHRLQRARPRGTKTSAVRATLLITTLGKITTTAVQP
jgi:hypothetical protein